MNKMLFNDKHLKIILQLECNFYLK